MAAAEPSTGDYLFGPLAQVCARCACCRSSSLAEPPVVLALSPHWSRALPIHTVVAALW